MKNVIICVILSLALLATPSVAQRGGGGRIGGGPVRGAGRAVGPHPIYPRVRPPNFNAGVVRNRYNGTAGQGSSYAGYYGDFGIPVASGEESQSGPGMIFLMPVMATPPDPPPTPPPPAKPVVREYHWPGSDLDGTDPVFSIVSNDRGIYYATMIWRDGDTLHLKIRNGGAEQLPYSSILREATQLANPGKNLKAWLH